MSNPNEAPPANPVLTYYNEWVERTPYVTRVSLIGITILYLFSWIIDLDQQLGNVPYFTVAQFEVYRILTSPVVGNSFFTIIMIFLFFPQMGGRLESSMGSAGYLSLMGMLSVITNITYIGVCYLLYIFGMVESIFWSCSGFWTVIFAFITIECMLVPDAPRQLMFIPVDIPSKYFPLILYLLFTLLSGGPTLSYAVAIGIGFIYSQGFLDRLKLTSYYLEELESPTGCCHGISRSKGWVLAGTTGHDAWIAVNANDPDINSSTRGAPSTGNNSGGRPQGAFPNVAGFGGFSGGSGGDDEEGGQNGGGKNMPFPGSGRTLTTGTTQSGGLFGSSSQTASTAASKEAVAQRRLAALGAMNQSQSSNV